VRRSVALVLLCVGALLAVSVSMAQADTTEIVEPQGNPPTVNDGWQAATCTKDTPKCSPAEPNFFTQAAGHPPIGFTQYTIQHEPPGTIGPVAPIKAPEESRSIKTLKVDLPPGLTVNPNATTSKCSLEEFEHEEGGKVVPLCAAATKVGVEQITLAFN